MVMPSRLTLPARKLLTFLPRSNRVHRLHANSSISQQLDHYLDLLAKQLQHSINKKEHKRILAIIERNNAVAKILDSVPYRRTVKQKKDLLGKAQLGLIFCIDGRIPAIFLGGRFARHWEVPAGEITVTKRKSDGKLIPESSDLSEAFREIASQGGEVLEVVLAHTSFLGHGCGAMAAKKKAGVLPPKTSVEDANIQIIEETTLPAITTIFNDFRLDTGNPPLQRVGIAALYDTDTGGIILNHPLRKAKQALSTTELTNRYASQIAKLKGMNQGAQSSFKTKFSKLEYLTSFSEAVANMTELLMARSKQNEVLVEIDSYLEIYYADLTKVQQQALRFLICRTIAFQFLTGLSKVTVTSLNHAFAEHEEKYLAVSLTGATLGKFDPEMQGFSSTPADAKVAISNIKTKLSIMGKSTNKTNFPYILFICSPTSKKTLKDQSGVLRRTISRNAELLRSIVADPDLSNLVKTGSLLPVSVLIAEDTREVLEVIDHSAYI